MTTPRPSCVETIESIVQWGDETFGPCHPSRAVERAGEEWAEMLGEEPGSMQHSIEAADVIIVLLRIPNIIQALNEKMAKNRARKWNLKGDGTGYHKSPAQLLAEECPHGMTEEQAQWVLDRDSQATSELRGKIGRLESIIRSYEKATGFDDSGKCPICGGAEGCSHTFRERFKASTTPADAASERNIPHADGSRECHPVDAAPSYVFGPWVSTSAGLRCDLPSGANYQWRDKDHDTGKICARSEDRTWAKGVEIRRAYRIGHTYPHDGGECPLADGGVRVKAIYHWCALEESADRALWPNVTSFTPLDQGDS